MDLYPWVCAIYIEEEYRGNAYGAILLENAKTDAKLGGFNDLYLVQIISGYMKNLDLNSSVLVTIRGEIILVSIKQLYNFS